MRASITRHTHTLTDIRTQEVQYADDRLHDRITAMAGRAVQRTRRGV